MPTNAQLESSLPSVLNRVLEILPVGVSVVEAGGGDGSFSERLVTENGNTVEVWDHNPAAITVAETKVGVKGVLCDFENPKTPYIKAEQYGLAIDILQYLSDHFGKDSLATRLSHGKGLLIIVPNNREPLSTDSSYQSPYTEASLNDFLEQYDENHSVEEAEEGYWLIGILGPNLSF